MSSGLPGAVPSLPTTRLPARRGATRAAVKPAACTWADNWSAGQHGLQELALASARGRSLGRYCRPSSHQAQELPQPAQQSSRVLGPDRAAQLAHAAVLVVGSLGQQLLGLGEQLPDLMDRWFLLAGRYLRAKRRWTWASSSSWRGCRPACAHHAAVWPLAFMARADDVNRMAERPRRATPGVNTVAAAPTVYRAK